MPKLRKFTYFEHLLTFASCLGIALISWKLTPLIGITNTLQLFIISVILTIWFGSQKTGIITAAWGIVNAFYLFLVKNDSPFNTVRSLYEIALFTIIVVLVNYVIELYKKTDLKKDYEKKEEALQAKLAEFADTNSKMKEEIKLRDEFLSIASHELKTPLTSMLLKIQLVLHNIRNVSLAQFSVVQLLKMLETAEHQTKRLSRMINDLLNVSLITTHKMNLEPADENITEIVKNVVGEFSEKLEKGGYSVTLKAEEEVSGWVDKLRIEQVFTNLISNAIKYGNGKPIEVIIAKKNGKAKITVKDQGIGIPENQRGKIFELFERSAPNVGYKGLGVGLFIANQIIAAHGGTIKVESKEKRGTTFTVEIPLTKK